jgi:hypothetical protein
MASQDTRSVVERYFNAWTGKRVADARALLADDLHFSGPSAEYVSADAFLPALQGFAALTRSARISELLVDGDRAALFYDCELPEPCGTIRIASFFQVAEGKIRNYETLFDPSGFRKLQAQK